jgi:microsomal dipeptidase-like Zn-dependent dipeptidase
VLNGKSHSEEEWWENRNLAKKEWQSGLLKQRGYKKAEIEGIISGNFLNFLRKHLPA